MDRTEKRPGDLLTGCFPYFQGIEQVGSNHVTAGRLGHWRLVAAITARWSRLMGKARARVEAALDDHDD